MMLIIHVTRPICKWELSYTLSYGSAVQRPRQQRRLLKLYNRVQCVSFSELVCVCGWSWGTQDACLDSCSVAGCVLRCFCPVRCGKQSEGFPAEVRRGGHPAYLQLLAGIMGLQHQHHKGDLRQTGEHSESCSCRRPEITRTGPVTEFWCVSFPSNQSEEGEIWSNFYAKMSEESQKHPIDEIVDPELKLQLISLQDKGAAVLPKDKAAHVGLHLKFLMVIGYLDVSWSAKNAVFECIETCVFPLCVQLSKVMSEMSTIYSTATVCLMDDPLNCQTLEPGTLLIRSRYGHAAACCRRPAR